MGGCIAAGIYTTNSADACKYISQHSKAEVLIVEGNKQLEKYSKAIKDDLPNLKAIVVWGEVIDMKVKEKVVFDVYDWESFLLLGINANVSDSIIDERLSQVKPGNCSTLIYTSGTTGPPKAVMISHGKMNLTLPYLNHIYLIYHLFR